MTPFSPVHQQLLPSQQARWRAGTETPAVQHWCTSLCTCGPASGALPPGSFWSCSSEAPNITAVWSEGSSTNSSFSPSPPKLFLVHVSGPAPAALSAQQAPVCSSVTPAITAGWREGSSDHSSYREYFPCSHDQLRDHIDHLKSDP